MLSPLSRTRQRELFGFPHTIVSAVAGLPPASAPCRLTHLCSPTSPDREMFGRNVSKTRFVTRDQRTRLR